MYSNPIASRPAWRRPISPVERLVGAALLAGLVSCASSGGTLYFQSFEFDTTADARRYGQPDVEVLDYAYGESHRAGTVPSKSARELAALHGRGYPSGSVAGFLPRAEFLSVKWRDKATGETHEDRVDLRDRLPREMTNYQVRFVAEGARLHVYAFPPLRTTDLLGHAVVAGGQPGNRARGQAFEEVPYNLQHQIYPDVRP